MLEDKPENKTARQILLQYKTTLNELIKQREELKKQRDALDYKIALADEFVSKVEHGLKYATATYEQRDAPF